MYMYIISGKLKAKATKLQQLVSRYNVLHAQILRSYHLSSARIAPKKKHQKCGSSNHSDEAVMVYM